VAPQPEQRSNGSTGNLLNDLSNISAGLGTVVGETTEDQ
jgi:hypothetical protein